METISRSPYGIEFKCYLIVFKNIDKIIYTYRDTAGQERLHSIGRGYYRRAQCIIFCYDLSREDPFININLWKEQIKKYAAQDVLLIIVGCKFDLATDEERLKRHRDKVNELMEQDLKEFKPISCECSAKTNHNIKRVFLASAELALEHCKDKLLLKNDDNGAIHNLSPKETGKSWKFLCCG